MASIDLEIPSQTSENGVSTLKFTRADLGPIALLIACVVGMFWRILFTPALLFYRDICNYTYPSAQLIREICRHGSLPFWNPYLNYGQPILANPNLLFFYPSTFFIVYFPFDLAYKLHFVVHFCIAATGMYLLARAWGQSYKAAFFAAFIFVFSGQVLSLGNFYNTVACCAWIPWALLATEHALGSNRLRPWILLTVVFTLQWLAAEPFSMMATFVLSFAYAVYRKGTRDRILSPANIRLLAIYGAIGCTMLLLCAVQFLPASDMLNHSHRRDGLNFSESATWSVNPLSFLEVLMPSFSGSIFSGPSAWYWLISDENDAYNISNFLGFMPIFFGLAGWALSRDRRRNFIGGAAVLCLLLSLGHFFPVFALARLVFPPLSIVRFPIKLLVHVVFLLAILAGWGFDTLTDASLPLNRAWKRLSFGLSIFLGFLIVMLAAAWLTPSLLKSPQIWIFHHLGKVPYKLEPAAEYLVTKLRIELPGVIGFCLGGILLLTGFTQKKRWAVPGAYILAVVAMGQLFSVNSEANPTVPRTFYTYRPPVLDEFKDSPGDFRFISLGKTVQSSDPNGLDSFVNFQSVPGGDDFSIIAQGELKSRMQLYTGSMIYKVEGSIDLDPERSIPPFLFDVKIFLNRMKAETVPFNCVLGRLNVKYIISPQSDDTSVTRLLGKAFNGSTVPSNVYDDLCFVPRTYVAGNSLFITDSKPTLALLASPKFDAMNTAILAAPEGSAPSVSGAGGAGEAEVVSREPDSITLRARLTRPGYVLLLDRFDPNWQATIDSHPATVLRANQVFRAVYVQAGVHEIRYVYHQRGLAPGFVISLITLLAILGLYVRG